MAKISAQELAELVPCPLEHVVRLEELGILAPEEDALYASSDVHVVRLMAARPHEVLVSEEAKRSAGAAGVEFELIGDVPLKGVSRSVRLHKATRAPN
jgi:NCAIR mutase (PurE)-related protein